MSQPPIENPEEFLARRQKQKEQFAERIAGIEVTDLFGVVDPMGPGLSRDRDEELWEFSLRLAAWKQPTTKLSTDELHVSMPLPEDAAKDLLQQIQSYDIVQLKARIGIHPDGDQKGIMSELVSHKHSDAELEAFAAELQRPVTIEDDSFGTLTLERKYDWFECDADWQGRSIPLTIDNREPDRRQSLLDIAKELWANQDKWLGKALDYAAAELLDIKNEAWLDEGEPSVTAQQFKSRMTLTGVGIVFDGTFDLNFDDGDLFWGHEMGVEGSLERGMTNAEF